MVLTVYNIERKYVYGAIHFQRKKERSRHSPLFAVQLDDIRSVILLAFVLNSINAAYGEFSNVDK